MYQLFVTNQAKKDLKRLDRSIIKIIVAVLDNISENPHAGESLSGDLAHLKKWSFTHLGIGYRIAYQIYDDYIEVKVLMIGTRENFYDELKRRK